MIQQPTSLEKLLYFKSNWSVDNAGAKIPPRGFRFTFSTFWRQWWTLDNSCQVFLAGLWTMGQKIPPSALLICSSAPVSHTTTKVSSLSNTFPESSSSPPIIISIISISNQYRGDDNPNHHDLSVGIPTCCLTPGSFTFGIYIVVVIFSASNSSGLHIYPTPQALSYAYNKNYIISIYTL